MRNQDYDHTRRSQAPTEQIPHSGVYHDEQPVQEFDTTLRDAPIPHTLPEGTTTEHLPPYMRPEEEKGKRKKGPLLIAGTALAGLGVGVSIFLNQGSSADKGHQPAVSTTSASPSSEKSSASAAPASTVNPELYAGRVNPETLVNMTHEQLVQAMQITPADAPTPEKFSQLVVQRLDTWANAGMTPQELSAFPSTNPQGYDDAMQAKYDAAFGEGLFGYNKNDSGQASAVAHNHRFFLERFQLANRVGQTNYNVKIVFESALVTSSNPGSDEIQITAHLSDNLGEGMNSPNLTPLDNDGTLSVTMRDWDNDGVYDLQISDSTLYK